MIRTLLLTSLLPMSLFLAAQDSVRVSGIKPGILFDYGKGLMAFSPDSRKWEGGLELILKDKIQAIAEFGQWDLAPESVIENGSYQIDGTYWRIGVGYAPRVDNFSRVGIGFRYARSSYQDAGNYVILNASGLQPDIEETFARTGQSAQWYEAVFYTDKAIKKWLAVGFQFRLRFMQSYTPYNQPAVMIVPGYGRAEDDIVPAVNLFLKIIPLN